MLASAARSKWRALPFLNLVIRPCCPPTRRPTARRARTRTSRLVIGSPSWGTRTSGLTSSTRKATTFIQGCRRTGKAGCLLVLFIPSATASRIMPRIQNGRDSVAVVATGDGSHLLDAAGPCTAPNDARNVKFLTSLLTCASRQSSIRTG